jgi:Zn-dependent protease
LGDKTVKFNKRLSLNPIRHIEIVGLLFLMLTGFGWGRPVETSPKNFMDKKKGTILTGISGPLISMITALLACFAIAFIDVNIEEGRIFLVGYAGVYTAQFLQEFYRYSLNLAIISLLPFKPFDGFMIWGGIIPPRNQFKIFQYQGLILTIFILVILISPQIFSILTNPIGMLLQNSAEGGFNVHLRDEEASFPGFRAGQGQGISRL